MSERSFIVENGEPVWIFNKTKVKIHIPVHRTMEASHVKSLLDLWKYELERGVLEVDIKFLVGESLISRARNTIAYDFLNSDFEYLFMIDSDIVFLKDVLEKLLARKKDLVAANYVHKTDSAIRWAGVCDDETLHFSTSSFIPTGCMLVHRRVFEKLMQDKDLEYYDTSSQQNVAGFFVPYIDDERIYLSEDWAFSRRCLKAGIQGWLDNTIPLAHIGFKAYFDPSRKDEVKL